MEKSGFRYLEEYDLNPLLKKIGYSTAKKWVNEIISQTILHHQNQPKVIFRSYSFMIDEDVLKTFHECVKKAGFTSLNSFWQHKCKILINKIKERGENEDVKLD